eukprot:TRINITY_DN12107_c0_g1_i1.p1 TRINITY_DN12107_c0_g1~~TRINITY_DN12107_c0_g1_i1.p1  ORF type:complete len:113 (-),score=15.86 TRINITY_DN12107_c0_g1_i1:172-510(-)
MLIILFIHNTQPWEDHNLMVIACVPIDSSQVHKPTSLVNTTLEDNGNNLLSDKKISILETHYLVEWHKAWVCSPDLIFKTALVVPGVHLCGFSGRHQGISLVGSKTSEIPMP